MKHFIRTGMAALFFLQVFPVLSPAMALEYEFEPCCDLCSAAADESQYDSGFLKIFPILVDGHNDWLFRSEKDFMIDFGAGDYGYDGLEDIARLLKEKGVDLVMVKQPTRGLVHPEKIEEGTSFNWAQARYNYLGMNAKLASLGIVTPDFSSLIPFKGDDEYFFRRDHHWTPQGARATAKLVAQAITNLPAYKAIPEMSFNTSRVGMIKKDGTLQRAASRICGFDYPSQFVDQYTTEEQTEDNSVDDNALFGDDSLPEIVLIGTSNSKGATDYNFAGFLRDELSRDVLNEAMVGGSYDGSLIQYLLTDDFQQTPPKILIWEIPAYHRLQSELFYRQIRPMITDGCEQRNVSLSEEKALGIGRNELLFNGGGRVEQLLSGSLILDLTFNDPNVKEAILTVWYVSGKREKLHLEIPSRISTDGRFMVELNSDETYQDQIYLGLDIEISADKYSDGNHPTSVKASICEK